MKTRTGWPSIRRAGAGASDGVRRRVSILLLEAMVLVGLLVLGAMGSAIAVDEPSDTLQEVSWFHANPGAVRRFILYVSPTQGSIAQARQIDVGKPRGESANDGQIFSAMVEMESDEFVAVAAVGSNGLQSALSGWARPQPSAPGQPLPAER